MNQQKGTTVMPQYNETWNEYQKLVMFRLDQQDNKLEKLEEKTNQIHTDISSFKSNARFTGALAGFIVSLLGFLFNHFRSSQAQ
jgi:uncharacterized membrane protein (DUF106 family)